MRYKIVGVLPNGLPNKLFADNPGDARRLFEEVEGPALLLASRFRSGDEWEQRNHK